MASLAQKLLAIFERVGGIEPPATGWKPVVLPLYDTRVIEIIFEF